MTAETIRPEDETSDTTLADLTTRNGDSDDDEPWTAGDDCPMIEARGEDLIVLCEDGVCRWTNHRREWAEVDHWQIASVIGDVYVSGRGGNRDAAARVHQWLSRWWDVQPLDTYLD